MEKANIFGYPVNLTTQDEALNFVIQRMENQQGLHLVTINPEIIASADKNSALSEIIRQAGLVIPDSVGMELAIRSMGIYNAEKIPGIEFSENLLKICAKKGFRVAFLGGEQETLEKINFPAVNVVFSHHGYFNEHETPEILARLEQAEPHLLLVGLGCPKQEFFINLCRQRLPKTVMIGVGGSFDVWAKKVKRAPVFFRTFGLEWFYRLITQPGRFKRMFPVLPMFFLRIVFERDKLEKIYENE